MDYLRASSKGQCVASKTSSRVQIHNNGQCRLAWRFCATAHIQQRMCTCKYTLWSARVRAAHTLVQAATTCLYTHARAPSLCNVSRTLSSEAQMHKLLRTIFENGPTKC